MKDAALMSPQQRAVALVNVARGVFKPQYIDRVLDEKQDHFGGLSAIQYARKGISEFREAENFLIYHIQLDI